MLWYSKKQNNVESSTFGAEFVALKTALDLAEGLIYKLRMLGVRLEGPARVFCDNEAVVKSGSFPEITLKKKTSSIAFHRVREAVACSKILLYYEKSSMNIADLFTKVLPKHKQREFIRCVLTYLFHISFNTHFCFQFKYQLRKFYNRIEESEKVEMCNFICTETCTVL